MFWCADQPDSMETGGLFYLLALKTVFTALYIQEWFLTALFFLSYSQQRKTGKADLAGGILMVRLHFTIFPMVFIYLIFFSLSDYYHHIHVRGLVLFLQHSVLRSLSRLLAHFVP